MVCCVGHDKYKDLDLVIWLCLYAGPNMCMCLCGWIWEGIHELIHDLLPLLCRLLESEGSDYDLSQNKMYHNRVLYTIFEANGDGQAYGNPEIWSFGTFFFSSEAC